MKTMDLLKVYIESEHLLLVPISPVYRTEIFGELSEEITKYMHILPVNDISKTDEFIKDSIKGLRDKNNLQLVIISKESKEFFGCVGLHRLETKTPELGIWLKKSAHGKCYGREAITSLKEWADLNLTYDYLLYPVAEKNIPSRKIPESLGGIIEREYDEKMGDGDECHSLEYWIYPPSNVIE